MEATTELITQVGDSRARIVHSLYNLITVPLCSSPLLEFSTVTFLAIIYKMRSLRLSGIPAIAVAFLITLSVLALIGMGEGFKLLVHRGQRDGHTTLPKRDGSALKFALPWE